MDYFYQDREHSYFSKQTINICYPAHFHQELELFYCKEGSVNITIHGTEYQLQEGDLSLCFPDCIHSIVTPDTSSCFLCIFSPDLPIGFESILKTSHPEHPCIKSEHLSEECLYLLTQLKKQSGNPCDPRITNGYLTALIGLLLPHFQLCSNQMNGQDSLIKLILSYIQHHFTEPLSLDLVSRDLGISKYYISRIFTTKIGLSFPAYVNRERIRYAKSLIRCSQLSMTEIAFQVGFNSTRTFYRIFGETCQMSPLAYKNTQSTIL